MKQTPLPTEFSPIYHLVNNVIQKTENEWEGSCPKCAGNTRFVMWRVGRMGHAYGWCRNCPYTWSPKSDHKPTQAELDEWRTTQIRIEEERKRNAEKALALLNNEKVWEKFHSSHIQYSRDILKERGFTDTWIDYLKFGFIPDYVVHYKSGDAWQEYFSPAITIPVWGINIVQNVKLRVVSPRDSSHRYRNWYDAGDSYLYIPLHDIPLSNCAALIVEGEFKAGILEQTIDDIGTRVVGIQSKTPSPKVFEKIKNCDPIYVGLDPDAFEKTGKQNESAVDRVVRMVGKERARIVHFPCKPDDGILAGMNPMPFIRMAEKA